MIVVGNFEEKYTYDESVISTEFDEDQTGMLETFGEDLEMLLEINAKTPARVWTMIDGEDDNIYIVAGIKYPAIYHVVSNEEWQEAEEKYLFLKEEGE